ncbi:lysophospholipid acyltransferase family protein [Holophaga foetida]|uniref:LpxL/LpxP family acyltransferase n=1 Tax=Holophaga foetida TaxID=35839 RepID=UPI00024717C0|nr:lysophospholipid acyltransferase family protein [Holophaga foetida]
MKAPAWTGRSLGAAWQHRFFYGLIRHLGRRPAYWMADLVSLYYVLAKPSVRAKCRPYLSHRFGHARPVDAWRLSRELARVLVDRAAVGILGPGALETAFSGRETLNGILAEGKGLILVTAHVGAWQLGMANLKIVEAPVTVVMHRNPGDVDRQYFEHGEGPAPFRVLDPDTFLGGSLEMLQILQRGEVLCVMGDRVLGDTSPTVEADFLGAPVELPYGPFKLASLTGAPIVVAFPYKPGMNRYELRVADVIRVPPGLGRRSGNFRPYVQVFAASLEAFTRDFPYHFFNFFDMWAPTPERRDRAGA